MTLYLGSFKTLIAKIEHLCKVFSELYLFLFNYDGKVYKPKCLLGAYTYTPAISSLKEVENIGKNNASQKTAGEQ
ncbi:MAG TPA: hypothetical protein IGS40_18980 [Trichormus sp. M33_DOE_039]|nr:hypothetical protein [Trichormus sp. M33_DOE_039]